MAGRTLTRADLSEAVHRQVGLSRTESAELVKAVLDEMVDSFDDDRGTNGFNYQIDAVNADLAAGRKESLIVPLSASLRFQTHMDRIRAQFPQ